MKPFFIFSIFFLSLAGFSQEKISYQKVSERLLQQLIDKNNIDKEVQIIQQSSLEALEKELKTDAEKIAFWVNIYNAFIQITLLENPNLYANRGDFFSTKRLLIAGEKLSFDDIEHGILRKSKIKIGLGYLRKWFRPRWERKLRVNTVDWRIHFALNCGAKSCPPIGIYQPKKLDEQLNFMTKAYLKEQTTFDVATKTAISVVLFSWFRGDFGGKSGACKILKNYNIVSEEPKKLKFTSYNWTLALNNYKTILK